MGFRFDGSGFGVFWVQGRALGVSVFVPKSPHPPITGLRTHGMQGLLALNTI